MKRNKLISILLAGATVLCAGAALLCNAKVESIETEYQAAEETYADIAKSYAPSLLAEGKTDGADSTEGKAEEEQTVTVLTVDFEGLNAQCPFGSAAGWLICEGTHINYPVMQCDDNNYYLHRLSDGTYNFSGSLYTDFRCAENFTGTNTIIYGHNMASGAMFGELSRYINDGTYFEEHPDMTLITPNGNYKAEVFSAFVTVTGNEKIWQTEFESDEDYGEYLNWLKQESRIPSGPNVPVTPDDKIVTLITCAAGSDSSRTLVLAKLTEIS